MVALVLPLDLHDDFDSDIFVCSLLKGATWHPDVGDLGVDIFWRNCEGHLEPPESRVVARDGSEDCYDCSLE